jgi:capsular polysaccharide biosynthesis protein
MSLQDGRLIISVRWPRAIAVVILAVMGFTAGSMFAAFSSPVPTSQVALLTTGALNEATQAVIAGSDPVLSGALRYIGPPTSLTSLSRRVQARSLTSRVIVISAQGSTAASAEDTANAVVHSFIAYGSHRHLRAQVLEPAVIISGPPLSHRLLIPAGIGALLGALIGVIAGVMLGRSGRSLRLA